MSLPKKSKAGRSAWREHRRQLLRPAIFGVAFMVVCFIYAGLAANGYMGPLTTVLFGLCIFSVYYYWNKSMNHIDARWGEGARGESVVGRELERLYKEGFYVFHDWDTGRGNVDHFAIGPQGVFAVETKALKGEVTCEGGRLLQDSRHIPGRDVAKQASGGAAAVNGLIRKSSGLSPWVHAIVCFSRAEVSCYGSIGKVEITNPGSLNKTIVNRSKPYSPENVEEIADLLEKNIGVSPAAAPGSPPEKTGRITAFFARERNLVVAILCFMLLVSLVFAGTTADFLEHVTGTYRSIEAIGN